MPRIPQEDLDRIKSEIDLAALVRAKGVELKPHGTNDLIGRCPFHNDKTPSLVVTSAKGLWHCLGACQVGGSVVDWVMKTEGVSFRHAVTILQEGKAASLLSGSKIFRVSTTQKLACPLTFDAGDQDLLNQVTAYYHETLKQSPAAIEYLRRRGIVHPDVIATFKLGYADRTLGLRLPDKNRDAGATIREHLQKLGVFRSESGHEHLCGSLVIPILDAAGNTLNLYGRKILDRLRAGTPKHLYLPGPHLALFNPAALSQGEIILCESLIDALSFWVNGFRNVTCAYGVEGFTEDMLTALLSGGVRRVFLAYDRDEAGDRAAAKLGEKLISEGLEALRVQFPHGMDANEYIQKVKPADKALRILLHGAEWMGKGKKPVADIAVLPSGERVDVTTGEVLEDGSPSVAPEVGAELLEQVRARYPHLQAEQQILIAEMWDRRRKSLGMDTPLPPYPVADDEAASPSPPLAASLPAGFVDPESVPEAEPASGVHLKAPAGPQAPGIPYTAQGEDVHVTLGDRIYRVRGLSKNNSYEVLKVNLRVSVGERYYLDTLDFYNAKAREGFVAHAAVEIEYKADVLKRDLGRLLLLLERLQEERIAEVLKPKDAEGPALSEEEEAEALAFLRAPDLTARLVADLTTCGYVGEEENKLACYLVAVSRKLDDPLSVIIQSNSASGKSSLMDAVLSMVPPEEKLEFSALTGQALFYMEKNALRHKLISVAEDGGLADAVYSLKGLITDKKLRKASPGKDPQTGKMVTLTYEVDGPAAMMVSSTAAEIDVELKNRCLVLTLNEDREQTEAILKLQRFAQTLDGKKQKKRRNALRTLHHNAQRLLRRIEVVNRFAPLLHFSSEQSRVRRDQMKYLGLMNTLALLHQYQRPLKRDVDAGEYVEVSLEDVAICNRLCAEVLGRTLDELSPQTRRLLELLTALVQRIATEKALEGPQIRLSRFDIRKHTRWSDTALKVHLRRLVELEYLVVHRSSRGLFEYELLYRGEGDDGGRFMLGLIDVEELRKKAGAHAYDSARSALLEVRSGQNGKRSGVGQGPVSPRSGGGPGGETAVLANNDRAQSESNTRIPEKAYGGKRASSYRNGASYPQPAAMPATAP